MAISDKNTVLYATVSKELKEWIKKQAENNQRTMSGEVSYILLAHKAKIEKMEESTG